MILFVVGFVLILGSALAIRFPDLASVLKEHDRPQWEKLGQPSGYGFADLGRSIGLLFWLLDAEYTNQPSTAVVEIVKKSQRRAVWVKYCFLLGAVAMLLGVATLAIP